MKSYLRKIKKIISNLLYLDESFETSLDKKLLIHQYRNLSLISDRIGVNTDMICDFEVIVSLTTYGKRILDVYITIESLMQQTLKPNRIILWLSKEEFNDSNIPLGLKKYISRGLTINYCEDWKSYKKLIPTLINYKKSIIITTDDDVIYLPNFVENLFYTYRENHDCIIFNRGHRITFSNTGNILPYLQWEWDTKSCDKSLLNVPTGNGGILYPPNSFDEEVLNIDMFMTLCPTTDDLWFKVMTLLKGKKCIKGVGMNNYLELDLTNEYGLNKLNNGAININDINLKKLFDKYGIVNVKKEINE